MKSKEVRRKVGRGMLGDQMTDGTRHVLQVITTMDLLKFDGTCCETSLLDLAASVVLISRTYVSKRQRSIAFSLT